MQKTIDELQNKTSEHVNKLGRQMHDFGRQMHDFGRRMHELRRRVHEFRRRVHKFNRRVHKFNVSKHELGVWTRRWEKWSLLIWTIAYDEFFQSYLYCHLLENFYFKFSEHINYVSYVSHFTHSYLGIIPPNDRQGLATESVQLTVMSEEGKLSHYVLQPWI